MKAVADESRDSVACEGTQEDERGNGVRQVVIFLNLIALSITSEWEQVL